MILPADRKNVENYVSAVVVGTSTVPLCRTRKMVGFPRPSAMILPMRAINGKALSQFHFKHTPASFLLIFGQR
jgi:hypothetical protein